MPMSLRGTLMILALLSCGSGAAAGSSDRLLTDFSPASPVTWKTVNDGVMGGRSRGGFRIDQGVLHFGGSTNTNGGGFSSIRSAPLALDLTGFDGIRLRVQADGRRYTFRLTTSTTRRGRYQPSYWADFETKKDAGWEVVDVPFERFRPQWRGRRLSGPKLDLGKIDGLGLMIYDKRDGPFAFQADWIRAYRKAPAFSMAEFRGKQRPLLLFAPTAKDARLAKQLAALEKTQAAFDERDMVLVVVAGLSDAIAGTRTLNAAEAKALRTRHGVKPEAFALRLVGKDGGVKRKADAPVEPTSLYALIDTMPMRQREMRAADKAP